MAVSTGDADSSLSPLGAQARLVTGLCPGWDSTWAQPDEGLQRKREKPPGFGVCWQDGGGVVPKATPTG